MGWSLFVPDVLVFFQQLPSMSCRLAYHWLN